MSNIPSVEDYTIRVGDYVQLNTNRIADPHTTGRVVQVDTISTFNGITTTIYVRWFNVDGKPDESPMIFNPMELLKIMPP